MELALSLGCETVRKPLSFLDHETGDNKDLGFCMGLETRSDHQNDQDQRSTVDPSDPTVQLGLLPFYPVLAKHTHQKLIRLPWLNHDDRLNRERGCSLDVNSRSPAAEEGGGDGASSVIQMEFKVKNYENSNKRCYFESQRASSRTSDEEENDNVLTRKKLRLSKDQSAFLEESFKEHNSLNPKQKLELAKQLNLRPRQVEVWFQNRRARTKLKQTEVDCQYLKRSCEKLGEENKRLQKELQELRALKTSQPFYNHLPPTTLTMCPSCERVASNAAVTTASNSPASSVDKPALLFPFFEAQYHVDQAQAQAH